MQGKWSKAKLLPYSPLNKWRGQKDLEGVRMMINQEGNGTGAREMEQGQLLCYSPLNEWRGQKDLEGDRMINQDGSGTGPREMEQGKTLALQSLK